MKKWMQSIFCAGILFSGIMTMSNMDVQASEPQIDMENSQILTREKRAGSTIIGQHHNNNRTKDLHQKLNNLFKNKKNYREPSGHSIQRAIERNVSNDQIIGAIANGKQYHDTKNDSTVYYQATSRIAVAEGYDSAKKVYFIKTVMVDVAKPGLNWQPK
ncbi:hypothetical protein CDB3_21915 [Bacillus sp. CDB3]|nr:hypothetical protein CDB3_21915 [Bacillus sp. CDB3]